jgi:copper(I)-binding protein
VFPITRRSALLVGLSLAVCSLPRIAAAHDVTAGSLTIRHPWARATAASAKTGALYLTVTNGGAEADRLLGVFTDVAEISELHVSEAAGDMMTMRMVDSVEIPAGRTVSLAPQGTHVMLMGLKAPLQKGATFPATLRFEKAGEVSVDVAVQGIADLEPTD